MKIKLSALLLSTVTSVFAVTLTDFSNFSQQDGGSWGAFFSGGWEENPSVGDPKSTFIQNLDSYEIKGVTDANTNFVEYYFFKPINLSVGTSLNITAKTLTGNQSSGFNIILFSNGAANFATYSVNTSALSTTDVTLSLSNLAVDSAFAWSAVEGFKLTGASVLSPVNFNISLNDLSTSAIPEPSTYAAMMGVAVLGLGVCRRRRRAA